MLMLDLKLHTYGLFPDKLKLANLQPTMRCSCRCSSNDKGITNYIYYREKLASIYRPTAILTHRSNYHYGLLKKLHRGSACRQFSLDVERFCCTWFPKPIRFRGVPLIGRQHSFGNALTCEQYSIPFNFRMFYIEELQIFLMKYVNS